MPSEKIQIPRLNHQKAVSIPFLKWAERFYYNHQTGLYWDGVRSHYTPEELFNKFLGE